MNRNKKKKQKFIVYRNLNPANAGAHIDKIYFCVEKIFSRQLLYFRIVISQFK